MNEALVRLVWERARSRCEYCQLPQALARLPCQLDHVIAVKHHGSTCASNLALSCFACNNHKATGGSKVTQGSIGFERSHRYRDREDRPYQPDAPARDAGRGQRVTPPVSSLARRVGVATSVVQVVYFLPVALRTQTNSVSVSLVGTMRVGSAAGSGRTTTPKCVLARYYPGK